MLIKFYSEKNEGCELSKVLDDYEFYQNSPIQKIFIIHDFLNTILPNRKK